MSGFVERPGAAVPGAPLYVRMEPERLRVRDARSGLELDDEPLVALSADTHLRANAPRRARPLQQSSRRLTNAA